MQIFAIAGGSGGGGVVIDFCCLFPSLLLIVLLIYIALTRSKFWAAGLALFIAGVPYFIMLSDISHFEPSTDGDVIEDQNGERDAVAFQGRLVAATGFSLLWVFVVRLLLILLRRTGTVRSTIPLSHRVESEPAPTISQQTFKLKLPALKMVDRLLLCVALYFVLFFMLPLLMIVIMGDFRPR